MKKIIFTLSAAAAAFSQDLPFERGEINPNKTTWLEKVSDEEFESVLRELQ
ncbi:hypothetical protein [Helicobacter sp.]|uniref:hypothetical protein n=1 Tax=Helicobacter sp. TaxID=218 RepID=UPI0025C580D1|nr:hypothetical protein [Helicobacter sp.]MCI5632436.1 hypothetical protein [Helicobacter sp.]